MFIDRNTTNIPSPFGVGGMIVDEYRQGEFRPSERRGGGFGRSVL